MHTYYIHMAYIALMWFIHRYGFSHVFFLVGQTVFICVNMANITTQLFFSVCLYAIIAAENVTCTINTSRHFGFECPLVMQEYGFSPVCTLICIF